MNDEEIARRLGTAFGADARRLPIVQALARATVIAHEVAPESWSLSLLRRGTLRLNFGWAEVFTIVPADDVAGVAVQPVTPPTLDRDISLLPSPYAAAAGASRIEGPTSSIAAAWPRFIEAYIAALHTIRTGARAWLPRNRRLAHNQGLVAHLVEALRERVPVPGWFGDDGAARTLALEQIGAEIDARGGFTAADTTDARERELRAIAIRRGQRRFREELLRAYEGRCAITDCDVEPALEAAHIVPFRGDHTNVVVNGLLLRADIHTLFDLRLISVDPRRLSIEVAPILRSAYGDLSGRPLRVPRAPEQCPDRDALRLHRSSCSF